MEDETTSAEQPFLRTEPNGPRDRDAGRLRQARATCAARPGTCGASDGMAARSCAPSAWLLLVIAHACEDLWTGRQKLGQRVWSDAALFGRQRSIARPKLRNTAGRGDRAGGTALVST